MPVEGSHSRPEKPAVLYFDATARTTEEACASLQLAGYDVFAACSVGEAEDILAIYGPGGGDGRVVLLLVDLSEDASDGSRLLDLSRILAGSDTLPSALIVSSEMPYPIPEAESLPCLRRPFASPALARLVAGSIDAAQDARVVKLEARTESYVSLDGPRREARRRAFLSLGIGSAVLIGAALFWDDQRDDPVTPDSMVVTDVPAPIIRAAQREEAPGSEAGASADQRRPLEPTPNQHAAPGEIHRPTSVAESSSVSEATAREGRVKPAKPTRPSGRRKPGRRRVSQVDRDSAVSSNEEKHRPERTEERKSQLEPPTATAARSASPAGRNPRKKDSESERGASAIEANPYKQPR
ncbi:MAG: hypothetical protein V3V08_11375 [Nannocystaceae bacterium]